MIKLIKTATFGQSFFESIEPFAKKNNLGAHTVSTLQHK